MKKFYALLLATFFLFSPNAFAMTFTETVKIGTVGFPNQAPYSGFIITGETHNTGAAHIEPADNAKTYVKGVARFDNGEGALFCNYDFNAKDFTRSMTFGGENDVAVTLNGEYKDIFKIKNSANLPIYALYHNYCVTELNIIGKRNGKWVRYINSKDISKRYFGGKDAYKEDGGIMYGKPVSKGDSIIIEYWRWHWGGESKPEGEFRLKWDEKAMWFGIEQVKY